MAKEMRTNVATSLENLSPKTVQLEDTGIHKDISATKKLIKHQMVESLIRHNDIK